VHYHAALGLAPESRKVKEVIGDIQRALRLAATDPNNTVVQPGEWTQPRWAQPSWKGEDGKKENDAGSQPDAEPAADENA
jgi:hypothetical protein